MRREQTRLDEIWFSTRWKPTSKRWQAAKARCRHRHTNRWWRHSSKQEDTRPDGWHHELLHTISRICPYCNLLILTFSCASHRFVALCMTTFPPNLEIAIIRYVAFSVWPTCIGVSTFWIMGDQSSGKRLRRWTLGRVPVTTGEEPREDLCLFRLF